MIRVFIVDDHIIVRQGLRRILEEAGDIEVAGEAANGVEALKRLRKKNWDVVLLDISMPQKNGADTLKQLMDEYRGARVVILSMYAEDQYAVRLMKAGASGYLTKDVAPEQLVDAIRKVAEGKKYINPVLAELLLLEINADSDKPPHAVLSDREYQVLKMLGSGMAVSEIAAALALSIKTVSTHRAHILAKMNLKNNAELTFYVVQHGLTQ